MTTVIKNGFLDTFPAFNHKNYRYYFVGQMISLTGTWLQTVAQGWLTLQLTNSAYMVGVITALNFLPVLLFGFFSGVLVDRFDKRKLIMFTQSLEMVLAIILGVLTITGQINILLLSILAFLNGIAQAIDMPARQSFTVELVGLEHLPSAIAVNMGTFNSARVIGPAFAGVLISSIGTGGAFILNGLSFLGPLIFLSLMRINEKKEQLSQKPHPLKSLQEGLKYTFSHSYIRNLLFLTAIISIFGFSYAVILPVIAQQIFHKDASGLGILYSAAGLGAVAATIFISRFHKHFEVERLIFVGSLLFVFAMMGFSTVNNFYLALSFLFFIGAGLAIQIAMVNSTIQFHVKHNLRGRVMGIYLLFLVGMQPVGSFQMGYLTEKYGPHFATGLGAVIILLFTLYISTTLPTLHKHAMAQT